MAHVREHRKPKRFSSEENASETDVRQACKRVRVNAVEKW
jgi:hypothetical protein